MEFFEYFKLIKTQTGYSVKYKNETLLRVNPIVMGGIIRDYATQNFIQQISLLLDVKGINEDVKKRAKQLEKLYTNKRKQFYKNKNLKHITEKTKDFMHFVKAIAIIDSMGVTYKQFLDAQIGGLAFVNNGNGVFPKPSQLQGANAEERMLQALKSTGEENSISSVKRISMTYEDKNTPLMENPRFVAAFNKIEKTKNASLKEALFVADCMLQRNGRVTDLVRQYIYKISGEEI